MIVGTVVLFYLYLFLLSEWTASGTSYAFLLFPVATAPMAAVVLGERVTWQFAIGAAIALIGVWVGAIWSPAREPSAKSARVAAVERCDPPTPGCI